MRIFNLTLLVVFVVAAVICLGGCLAYVELPGTMLERAACACKDDGGIEYIKIKAGYGTIPGLDQFNFECRGKLQTGWWTINGSMATPIIESEECE